MTKANSKFTAPFSLETVADLRFEKIDAHVQRQKKIAAYLHFTIILTRTDPRPASRAGGGSEFFHTKNSVVASSIQFAMSTRIPPSRVIETPLYEYLIYHIATFLGALVP